MDTVSIVHINNYMYYPSIVLNVHLSHVCIDVLCNSIILLFTKLILVLAIYEISGEIVCE